MLIVQGVFRVDPAEREAYLAQSVEAMTSSRAEQGCLEYVIAADPVEADRVVLSERWESRADLDEHVRALTERRQAAAAADAPPGVTMLSREITIYEIASSETMG